jgi:hypothetical protein
MRKAFILIYWLLASSAPALAQLGGGGLGGLGGLPGGIGAVPRSLPPIGRTVGQAGNTVGSVVGTAQGAVDNVGRPARPEVFETDTLGARAIKGEVLAVSPSAVALAAARRLNFRVARQVNLPGVPLNAVVLQAPQGMSATDALATLRMADPNGVYDYNHVYDPSSDGGIFSGVASLFGDSQSASAHGLAIGMVDSGIELAHPALKRANIIAKNVTGPEKSPAAEHGTAVASLLVGDGGGLTPMLRGAKLYAADVYGGGVTGGSADAIAKGLAWVAESGATVINVSLVGPANRLVEAVVKALLGRGHVIVAAVGNDGPAKGIEYPAAYDGVIAVTSVDKDMRIQLDANRGPEISFAALGVDVPVATLNKGYGRATGTSFAAPVVTARFARLMTRPDPAAARRIDERLVAEAVDLGAPGRDPVFGYGFLAPPPLRIESASFSKP